MAKNENVVWEEEYPKQRFCLGSNGQKKTLSGEEWVAKKKNAVWGGMAENKDAVWLEVVARPPSRIFHPRYSD